MQNKIYVITEKVEEADIVEDKAYDRGYDEGFSIAYSRNAFN